MIKQLIFDNFWKWNEVMMITMMKNLVQILRLVGETKINFGVSR